MRIAVVQTFSSAWSMAALETQVARHIKGAGHDVVLIHCGGLLSEGCVAMQEAGLTQYSSSDERLDICSLCTRRSDTLSGVSKIPRLQLMNQFRNSKAEAEVAIAMRGFSFDEWTQFEFIGIPVGRYAAYEFYLENKLSSLEIPLELEPFFKEKVRNTLRSLISWSELSAKEEFDAVILGNELYSTNRVIKDFCHQSGTRTYTLGMGTDLRKYGNSFTMAVNSQVELEAARHPGLLDFNTSDVEKSVWKQLRKHFVELATGRNAFSYTSKVASLSPEELRLKLGIPRNAPVVTVITSSLDERLAGEIVGISDKSLLKSDTQLFETPLDWLDYILQLGHANPSIHFVIRIHPRLFPNKRDGVEAEIVHTLKQKFKVLPPNISVNWPEDKISLYELALITDCALNHTSSAGLEFLALGIPVIQHDPDALYAYPSQFNKVVRDVDSYLTTIAAALAEGLSLENVSNAYTWKIWQFTRTARNLNDCMPQRNSLRFGRVLNWLVVRKRVRLLRPLLHATDYFELKRSRLDKSVVVSLKTLLDEEWPSLAGPTQQGQSMHVLPSSSYEDVRRNLSKILRSIYGYTRAKQHLDRIT